MFILIKNAHVYAPEDLGTQDVLICNKKIVKVAPKPAEGEPIVKPSEITRPEAPAPAAEPEQKTE